MADQATDEQFEEVVAEAKTEGNLSRANVVRKIKKEPSPPPARDPYHSNTHHIKDDRVIAKTGQMLMGLTFDGQLDRIDMANLTDRTVIDAAADFRESLTVLNRVARRLAARLALIPETTDKESTA